MKTWEELVGKAKEMAVTVSHKATDVADLAKMKMKMIDNEKAINSTMEALGHLLYDSRRDGVELNEELVQELIEQIKELETANEQLQAEIDNTRGRKTCTECGTANAEDAAYCNQCGKALD